MIRIHPISGNKKQYLDLLLLADEQESMIDRYLERGEMFILSDNDTVKASCVITCEDKGIYEIKSIAVYPEYQRQGYGRQLIAFVLEHYKAPEMLDNIRKEVPLMADYQPAEEEVPTNAQLYRIYIERYLCSLPVVNQEMDLIISQKEPTTYGVPIQVYFFSRNKVWKEYERIQSDIFDHLLVMVQKFDLKLYQYSD